MVAVLLSLMFMVISAKNANAQESRQINLEEAVRIALDSNLQVKSSSLSVQSQKALKGASWDFGKTNLDVEYGQFNSYTRDNSVAVSQSFSFPSVYVNQNRLATAKIISSEWQHKGRQLEIATGVKQVYWQLAYLYSKERLLIYQDSLYNGFMKAAELRAKSGETNNLEMITARSQSLDVKNQLQQTRADIGICTRRFQALLNTVENLSPADTILIRAGILNDTAGISQNPSLGYINQQAAVARNEKNLERSRMMPDLSIGYFSQTIQGTQDVGGVPRIFGPGDRFNGIQAGISVPLWPVPYISKTRAAKINENIARTDAEYYSSYLSGNLKSLYDEYRKYHQSLAFYETQALPEADLIIKQSTLSYKAGALDYLNYVITLTRALGIRQEHLNTLNNLNQTLINIEYITGKTF